ncbi:MAG: cation transporter [Pirellula sp.]|nr:cation transporter [Pirellula sp.]
MPIDDISPWLHEHRYPASDLRAERRTWQVVAITAVMMVVEIAAGRIYGSMALLADGWHMGTHVAALGITAGAYWLARRYADDERFAWGTYKIEVLGGFSSALVLGMVGLEMVVESVERLWTPHEVHYNEALVVTVIGLAVNVACALLLGDGHSHDHGHAHGADEKKCAAGDHEHGHDMNLRAAYVHVLADAFTSILAIVALVGGKFFGWARLDPLMGLVGAGVIAVWAVGLVRQAGRALVDREMDHPLTDAIRKTLEADGETRVTDLHIWRVGRGHFSAAVAVVSQVPHTADEYRARLACHKELVHLTIEVVQA